MLSSDARSCLAEQILDPLYDAIGRREPQLSRFRIRVLVDLSLAAGASVLRHRPRGGEQDATHGRAGYLDEAFDLLERGAADLLRGGERR